MSVDLCQIIQSGAKMLKETQNFIYALKQNVPLIAATFPRLAITLQQQEENFYTKILPYRLTH